MLRFLCLRLGLFPHRFFIVLAAHRYVTVVTTNIHLRPFSNRIAVFISTDDHVGFTAAVANSLQLNQFICPRK